jgi:hypothetical protein
MQQRFFSGRISKDLFKGQNQSKVLSSVDDISSSDTEAENEEEAEVKHDENQEESL